MKRKLVVGLLAFLTLAMVVSLADAAPWRGWKGSGGWGMGTPYQRMFNPATVETVAGTVEKIDRITPVKGMNQGVYMTLKTEKETVPVHLGPVWFIERLDMKIGPGDKLEVKGSRVTFDEKPAVIAAEIKKGESVIVLRDGAGTPIWAGSGWRR